MLFDALERGDVDAVAACYAPDMTMWANFTMHETTREENLQAITAGAGLHRRRTYNDRQIHTFHDGFVAQYTCEVVAELTDLVLVHQRRPNLPESRYSISFTIFPSCTSATRQAHSARLLPS